MERRRFLLAFVFFFFQLHGAAVSRERERVFVAPASVGFVHTARSLGIVRRMWGYLGKSRGVLVASFDGTLLVMYMVLLP